MFLNSRHGFVGNIHLWKGTTPRLFKITKVRAKYLSYDAIGFEQ